MLEMNLIALNQEVQTLFEQSNEPNVFFPDFEFHKCLQSLQPSNLDSKESVKRMMSLINAVLYLKTNKLKPCQIKFSHVGCDRENHWGLKYAICYKAMQSPKVRDPYENTQFYYHIDQDNELVWSLGKIWLRFYTNKKVTIIDRSQKEIDALVDENVMDLKINRLIKKMLSVKKQLRISFQKFVEDQVFTTAQNSHPNLFSSISLHFNMVSRNQKVNNSITAKREIKTPYEEQIFRRDMQEALDICFLLQKSKKEIRNLYEKSVSIEFSIFIIKAESYCILKKFDQKKNMNHIVDYTTHQKKFYSKFVTKMLTLKHQLERKMKMPIFLQLSQVQKPLLMPTDEMTLNKIHPVFKNIMVQYYKQSADELQQIVEKPMNSSQKLKLICKLEKRCLIFLLARLCNQIFAQLRSHIYEEFVKACDNALKVFNIQELLMFIENCQEATPLKLIRNKVFAYGFQGGTTSNQRIQYSK